MKQKTPEQLAKACEASKRYREKHPDKIIERHRKYREKNAEQIKERAKELREINADKIKEQRKEWRIQNKERLLEKEKEYRTLNKDRINALMNKRRRTVKQQALNYLGGNVCAICGHKSEWGCQFDFHHHAGEKEFGISSKISNGSDFETIKPELDKCTVLCRNCHALVSSTIWKEPNFPQEIKDKILLLDK